MTAEVLTFLGGDPRRVTLFEAAEAAVVACGDCDMAVTKSQISWGNPLKFAFLSLPLRLGRDRPEGRLVLSFGLGYRLEHPRIAACANPYPGRWTHHVVLAGPEDVDNEVRIWLKWAWEFAKNKKRGS